VRRDSLRKRRSILQLRAAWAAALGLGDPWVGQELGSQRIVVAEWRGTEGDFCGEMGVTLGAGIARIRDEWWCVWRNRSAWKNRDRQLRQRRSLARRG
jgi:hypothetical protein